MNNFIKKYFTLISSLIFFGILISVLYIISLKSTGGSLYYVLDDPYIHLGLVKNFIINHVWGHNSLEFSFSTSSPLWTGILYFSEKIIGNNVLIPFYLNILFSVILIFASDHILNKYSDNILFKTIIIWLLIFFAPLPALIFTGMEHILQILLDLLFIYNISKICSYNISLKEENKHLIFSLLLAPLVTTIRYEGLFIILAGILILFLSKRKFVKPILILLSSLIPILLLGFYSKLNGGFFFPNSILLKGNIPDAMSIVGLLKSTVIKFLIQIYDTPHVLVLLLMTFSLFIHFIKTKFEYNSKQISIIIYIIITIIHLQFAGIGWFFRYEAYLVYLGIITLAFFFKEIKEIANQSSINHNKYKLYFIYSIFIFLLMSPIIKRGIDAFYRTSYAATNIYEQQGKVSEFIKKYYNNNSIAMNDIGLATYSTSAYIFDLWGLGTTEVTKAKRTGIYDSLYINNALKARNVKLAFFYESWYKGNTEFNKNWLKAGAWVLSNNYQCGDSEVSFYAKDSTEYKILMNNLKDFSITLPKSVIQKGEYLK